jgi:hypothetical protein
MSTVAIADCVIESYEASPVMGAKMAMFNGT